MQFRKYSVALVFSVFLYSVCQSQIEVAYIKMKDFKAIGFGGFLNFSLPVAESAHYLTLEGGLQYFKDKHDQDVALAPVLVGFRYTLDQSGTGLYAEPFLGYTFGASSLPRYENGAPVWGPDGIVLSQKVAGAAAGAGIGYLFEPSGKIQFNIGLRYQHTFGPAQANVMAFRVSHNFTFGGRGDY